MKETASASTSTAQVVFQATQPVPSRNFHQAPRTCAVLTDTMELHYMAHSHTATTRQDDTHTNGSTDLAVSVKSPGVL